MEKDFDQWNSLKKQLNENERIFYAHPREIWWCSLGINIGAEIDGKHENFERPVVVVKVYNKQSLIVLPITTKQKSDSFHYKIKTGDKASWVKLTQMRMISTKRLLRKIDLLDQEAFSVLFDAWKKSL
jgi:mRNA interferase MazF